MADFPTLAILASIPILLVCGWVASHKDKWLTSIAILFSAFLLFGLGYLFDAGQQSQQVFLILFLLTGTIMAPVVLIYMILTLWNFLVIIKTR